MKHKLTIDVTESENGGFVGEMRVFGIKESDRYISQGDTLKELFLNLSNALEVLQKSNEFFPQLIVRKDDGEEFIHISNGIYKTKWGLINGSLGETPFSAFDGQFFKFYYIKEI